MRAFGQSALSRFRMRFLVNGLACNADYAVLYSRGHIQYLKCSRASQKSFGPVFLNIF